MKNRNLRSYAWLGDAATRKLDAKARTIDVIASTESEDSHGTCIDQTSWNLERYTKNPIVMLEHGMGGGFFGSDDPEDRLPIGRAENVRVEDGKLKARLVFPAEGRNELSDQVWMAIEDGRLNACSVGFRPGKVAREELDGHERYRLLNCTLYEISVVALPSNADCIAERSLLARFAADPSLLATLADGGDVDATQTIPQASTPATDTARETRATENRSMELLQILARMLGCTADEPSVISAIEEMKRRAEKPVVAELATTIDTKSFDEERATLTAQVSAAQSTIRSLVEALGLPGDAPVGDVNKAIAGLTARAARADELEPQVKDLSEQIAKHDADQAAREVEFLIARGKAYGCSYDERSRKALAAYRKADPKGFAEDHKAALDGLRAFDDPKLFERVAGGEDGKANASVDEQAARAVPVFAETHKANDALRAKADELQKAAAEKGSPISRADALEQAARSL